MMKTHGLTTAYDLRDATWEIVIMLAVAFILGYLFRKYWYEGQEVASAPSLKAPSQATPEVSTVDPSAVMGRTVVKDDLKLVEGIGPKIEELLHMHNIKSWSDLASASQDRLVGILSGAGDRFKMHNPNSWTEQASLARDGKWKELKEYQDFLTAGRG